MEKIADHGDGNYAYIDSVSEARRVLVAELGATLVTVAKDVKIQVEFNPAHVRAYRLIGYENRLLAAEDFNNDEKDAGEIGAGHRVTALYEIVPVGAESPAGVVDKLKYQEVRASASASGSGEIATVKVRHKDPEGGLSRLLTEVVRDNGSTIAQADAEFRFAAAVAEAGLLLRDDGFKGEASYSHVLGLIAGDNLNDRRSEFRDLVLSARRLVEEAPATR
jgi:Ca-activated chloride channel family protein